MVVRRLRRDGALKSSITFSAPCTKCTKNSLFFIFIFACPIYCMQSNRCQSKHWIGTSYREDFGLPKLITYGVYQKEKCPSTGKIHHQFFVVMPTRQRLTAMKKLFPGDHLEIARSPTEARAYCMKEETRVSSPIEVGRFVEPVSIDNMVVAVKRARVTEILEGNPSLWRSTRQIQELRQLFQCARTELTLGLLLVGPTGCGKTRTASLISAFVGDSYWHDCSQWWPAYDGQQLVILDEYRGQFDVAFLLRLLDRTPFKVPFKGGYTNFNSRQVIMTSNIPLEVMYKNLDIGSIAALKRRIVVINF